MTKKKTTTKTPTLVGGWGRNIIYLISLNDCGLIKTYTNIKDPPWKSCFEKYHLKLALKEY